MGDSSSRNKGFDRTTNWAEGKYTGFWNGSDITVGRCVAAAGLMNAYFNFIMHVLARFFYFLLILSLVVPMDSLTLLTLNLPAPALLQI